MKPFIILLNGCTLRCVYCFYTQQDSFGTDQLPIGALEKFITEAGDTIEDDVVLTGGEPLRYKAMPELIEFLIANKKTARINTNLWKSENVDWKTWAPALSRVDTSIDHVVPEINNKLRGAYEQTMEGIHRVREAGIPLGITVVVSKGNYKDVAYIRDELEKLNPAYLFFQPVDVSNPALVDSLCLSTLAPDAIHTLCNDLKPWATDRGYGHMLTVIGDYYAKGKRPEGACQMMRDLFVIDFDGEVYPCFHRHDLRAGNIQKDHGRGISDRVREAQQQIDPKVCFSPKCIPLF